MAPHVPEMQASLDSLRQQACFSAKLAGITVAGLLSNQIPGWQATLMRQHNKVDSQALLDSLQGTRKAVFVSGCTPEAAAWLDAGPGENGGAMANADYDAAYKLRLGV